MKSNRQEKIIQLITENAIETQEEILVYLREHGFDVTQATVSRDIKQLKLVKTQTNDGRYKYSVSSNNSRENISSKFVSLFSETVTGIDYANNIVVIKCYVGMANAACAAFDAMKFDGVVGSLSGDDTIFIAMRNEELAKELTVELKKIF